MINISFDNPLLLLLLIPMLAAVIVPYFVAIRKENKSRAAVIALTLHIVIVLLVVLAASGMQNVAVITETELYVVADVSYSTHDHLDLIDEYIAKIESELPKNSKMGVITFGKNYRLHTPLGAELTSVKNNRVNDGATDIVSALRYADSMFGDSAIKRIVLITDGMFTDKQAASEMIRTVQDLKDNGVYVDAIYVDGGLADGAKEIQLSTVEFNPSVYCGLNTTANVLVESTYDTNVIIKVKKNGDSYLEKSVQLISGYNVINIDLDTDSEGENDYEVTFVALEDSSEHNNKLIFTQRVNKNISILLLTSSRDDENTLMQVYGDDANIDTYLLPANLDVPFAVEELCKYDEIILSNVDVASVYNAATFIESLDTVVSLFGKSLITVGNSWIQNDEVGILDSLEDMLPVRFGNDSTDAKLYTLVIDSSRSMEYERPDFFIMAKLSATYLLGLLDEDDYFSIIHFSGDAYPLVAPQAASSENIASAIEKVNALKVTQSTMIGAALKAAADMMIPMSFSDKQVILISDGMSYEGGEVLADDPIAEAENLYASGITVSTLNTGNKKSEGVNTMRSIAFVGGGEYYFCESSDKLKELVLSEVADDVTDTEVLGDIPVNIKKEYDSVLNGVSSLGNISGYIYAKPKASAQTVMTVDYLKSGGGKAEAPLYAYWSYGSGRVATLTTNLSSAWIGAWSDENGQRFLGNVIDTNVPSTKNDHPYTVGTEYNGTHLNIEIIPAVINPDAVMNVKVTHPDGSESSKRLALNSYRYVYSLEISYDGKYLIDVSYDWATKSFTSEHVYSLSYSPEYDEFAVSSPAPIYSFMRNNGNVFENGDITLEVDEGRIATYVVKFSVPFLAAAAAIFIIDTVIRKLTWADIRSLFKKRTKEVK